MDPLLQLVVTWGPPGVTLALVLTGWLVPKYAYERERQISDRAHEDNAVLVQAIDRLTARLTDVIEMLRERNK